ncbi:MAG: pseudouridine-5'-phosphate glycosidase, partial [Pseudomonadota bacterium]
MNIKTTSEVADALEAGAAVVALESTIITHGMPYPDNLTMAKDVEQVVRSEGAIPATIAVIDGALQIGLIEEQLEKLAQTNGVMKLSRADLAYAMATGRTGGTTVAATMMAAHLAGIELFATGGIGGVHRGAETTFDISADLEELGQTPVTVVSAGPKAILDIPKTIEFLETKGVPIVAFGQDELPAFWSQKVGIVAPLRLDTPEQMADLIAMRRDLKALHHGGILIANP